MCLVVVIFAKEKERELEEKEQLIGPGGLLYGLLLFFSLLRFALQSLDSAEHKKYHHSMAHQADAARTWQKCELAQIK